VNLILADVIVCFAIEQKSGKAIIKRNVRMKNLGGKKNEGRKY